MTAEPTTDVQALRRLPVPQEIEDQVEETLKTLEVAGKLYQFKRTDRCRICKDLTLKQLVNKMLVKAFTYRDILNTLRGENKARRPTDQITYNVLYNHATEHFPLEKTGAGLFRAIQERNAEVYGQDFIEGVGTVLNALTYLETFQAKGYDTLVQEEYVVDPVVGMQASVKLHELLAKEGKDREELMELRYQLGVIMEAVKEESPELKSRIESKITQLVGSPAATQVEWTEEDEDEDEDEDDLGESR